MATGLNYKVRVYLKLLSLGQCSLSLSCTHTHTQSVLRVFSILTAKSTADVPEHYMSQNIMLYKVIIWNVPVYG